MLPRNGRIRPATSPLPAAKTALSVKSFKLFLSQLQNPKNHFSKSPLFSSIFGRLMFFFALDCYNAASPA